MDKFYTIKYDLVFKAVFKDKTLMEMLIKKCLGNSKGGKKIYVNYACLEDNN